MDNTSVRPTDDINKIVETYSNMLFRICLVILGNEADAEDAIQEVFIKYMTKAPAFHSPDHEKAWLITVTTNKCRDMLRSRKKLMPADMEDIKNYVTDTEQSHIIEALMTLPDKFRIVLILHYVEEYKVDEIAKIIGKTSSAVKMRLQKGRKLLDEVYRKEFM